MTKVRYYGGLLHGQIANRTGSHWSNYRKESGEFLSTQNGDRMMQGRNQIKGYIKYGDKYVHIDRWDEVTA
jgi:hypothetical protein